VDRRLLQKEVARQLGVSVTTINNWEMNHTSTIPSYVPRVLAFLGYDPREQDKDLGKRIGLVRERQGLSQGSLARKLCLNVSTVRAWEHGRVSKPSRNVRRRFEEYMEGREQEGGT
jgi:DNA-binding transcriptional regulator YiaG